MNYKRLIGAALTFTLANIVAAPIFGCVCEPPLSTAQELAQSDAVFSGKLISAKYKKNILDEFHKSDIAAFREFGENWQEENTEVLVLQFEVINWWKGRNGQHVTLLTSQLQMPDGVTTVGNCDFQFETNKSYLVYANGTINQLRTSFCSRTKPLRKAEEDLKLLDKSN